MRAKLNPEQIKELRGLSANGSSDRELGEKYGLSLSTVQRYKYDSARELSRRLQRNKPKIERICPICGLSSEGHPQCTSCTILNHNGQDECDRCQFYHREKAEREKLNIGQLV